MDNKDIKELINLKCKLEGFNDWEDYFDKRYHTYRNNVKSRFKEDLVDLCQFVLSVKKQWESLENYRQNLSSTMGDHLKQFARQGITEVKYQKDSPFANELEDFAKSLMDSSTVTVKVNNPVETKFSILYGVKYIEVQDGEQ